MRIHDIMNPNVDWVPPTTTIQDAAKRMRDENIGALPIGENDKLVGMITDRDIVVRLLPETGDVRSSTVKEAMSKKVLYCYEDQSTEEVVQNMSENHVRRLPVLNKSKRLVGMVSLSDIARDGDSAIAGKALGNIAHTRK